MKKGVKSRYRKGAQLVRRFWRATWRRPEREDVASISRLSQWGASLTMLNAIVLFLNAPGRDLGLWCLSAVMISLVLLWRSRRVGSRRDGTISRHANFKLHVFVLLMALPWIVLPGMFYSLVTPWDQAISLLVLAGMSSGGLIMLHRVMTAAMLYCGSILLSACVFSFLVDGLQAWPIVICSILFGAMLCASGFAFGEMSRERDASIRALTDANERIRRMAMEDDITGLPNRAVLMERLEGLRSRAAKATLLMLDLDNFKNVNDSFGHQTGDALLRVVGERLRDSVRTDDLVARLGGDEFAVLLTGTTAPETVRNLADNILTQIGAPITAEAHTIYTGASVGGAVFPEHADKGADLLVAADIALSAAKSDGRGRYVAFDPTLQAGILHESRIADALRKAIEAGSIEVHYQPKIRLADGLPDGAEALVRWAHPEMGPVRADLFLEVAAERGMIPDLSDVIFERVARDIATWRAGGLAVGRVSVNLHPVDLKTSDRLMKRIERWRADGIGPGDVVLEITEGCYIGRGADHAVMLIDGLKERGFELSLDDFGTGHAALTHLASVPVREVKIDRSFVRSLCTSPQGEAIVSAIVTLAKGFGLRVVGEGIESRDQYQKLLEMGVEAGQGYFWAPAMPADQFAAFHVLREAGAQSA